MKSKFQKSRFTRETVSQITNEPGVYSFYDTDGSLLYIGKALDLKKRISSYFHKNDNNSKIIQLVSLISYTKIIIVRSEYEALLLEAALINFYKPKYNVIWKDDKRYIYIKITKEKFPKILLARKSDDSRSQFYGPFPSVWIIRDLLSYIRTIFPYCTQDRGIKKCCFYSHIGLCNPCPGSVSVKETDKYRTVLRKYRSNISKIRSLLEGKYGVVEKALRSEMEAYSADLEFEAAARIRDKLDRLKRFLSDYHRPDRYLEDPYIASKTSEEDGLKLADILRKEMVDIGELERIESYDISNTGGKLATGSMVVFVKCRPVNTLYRRFRIRLKSTPDDFAMLSEIMTRRLSHSEWPLPDLFIIDGGKPQLRVLDKIFTTYKITIPRIGISKNFEEIVLPKTYKKIRLPNSSGALHLIQRIRDEAHRFAHKYHEKLRLKNIYA